MRIPTPLLLVALLVACGGGPPGGGRGGGPGGPPGMDQSSGPPDDRVLVETALVSRGSVSDHLVTTGLIESEIAADLLPETTGVVTAINVEEGDAVTKGQVLATLTNPSLEAGADRASIEIGRAKRNLEQAEALHAQGAISDLELVEAREAKKSAEATWSEASRSRGFTRITSPIDGVVALRNLRVGEVASGGRAAFQVVDLDRLRVVAQLPEKDIPRVREGQPVTLEGAYDASASATGHVLRVSPVVEAASGTVRVTVGVDPGQTALRPGQFVKVRVEVDRHDDVVTIPRRALVWEDGEPVAWRVIDSPEEDDADKDDEGGDGEEKEAGGDDGPGFFARLLNRGEGEGEDDDFDPWEGVPRREADKATLVLGFSDPQLVEVVEGLAEGDPVVVVGNASLRDGTAIRLVGDPELKEKPKEPKDGEDKADKADKAEAAEGADDAEDAEGADGERAADAEGDGDAAAEDDAG